LVCFTADYTKDQGSLNEMDLGWSNLNLWKSLRTGPILIKEDGKRLRNKKTRGDGAAKPPKSGIQKKEKEKEEI